MKIWGPLLFVGWVAANVGYQSHWTVIRDAYAAMERLRFIDIQSHELPHDDRVALGLAGLECKLAGVPLEGARIIDCLNDGARAYDRKNGTTLTKHIERLLHGQPSKVDRSAIIVHET